MTVGFNFFRRFLAFSEKIIKKMSNNSMPVSAATCCPSAKDNYHYSSAMYDSLKDLCHNNAEFFRNDDTESGQRLHAGFKSLIENIHTVSPLVDNIRKLAPSFDYDETIPGNGYRSFVSVVDSCINHGVKLNRQVCVARDSLLFRKYFYMKEVESCSQLLASLGTCIQHLHTMLGWADNGELFPSMPHSPQELFAQSETINQYCFYGRCLGFQFHPSLRHVLKGISICMAGFSEAYYNRGNIMNSVWAGGKYIIDPELRARRIVNISQFADIEFCKAFWFLAESEIMQKLPTLVSSSVAVNRLISIPPETMEFTKEDGTVITIPPPDAHIGPQTLNIRLISKVKREGMIGEGTGGEPRSRCLLLHCHGGGFVAQSSRSHEVYLRDWAARLDVPLLSVDYSLAPQAPYPRALQEVFYAYCWAMKHADMLGTTGERIVMVGDSAGANLNMATCLKTASAGLPMPHGIMLIYAPLLVNFVPSPARLLCLMDPLLPFGFMMRCLKAYACPPTDDVNGKSSNRSKQNSTADMPSSDKDFLKVSPTIDGPNGIMGVSDNSSFEEISESDLVELQAHKSPTSDHLSDTLSAASLSSEHRTLVTPTNEDRSQQYVSEFLEKYVLESDTDSEGHKIPVLRRKSIDIEVISSGSGHTLEATLVPDESTCYETTTKSYKGIHTRISEAAGSIVGVMSNTISNFTSSTPNKKIEKSDSIGSIQSNLDSLIARSPSDEFVFTVPKDPYLSPYWADDEILKKMPPMRILTVHLDPCLDDCVMFAKKMKNLDHPIGLDILDGLPHGFLNFSLMSSEAYNGSLLCVKRLKELLDMESLNKTSETTLSSQTPDSDQSKV